MITLHIPPIEIFDKVTNKFVTLPGGTFRFEHSLRAIFKWEQIYKVPFLGQKDLTNQQLIDYFCCMCLDERNFSTWYLTNNVVKQLADYMQDSHTATTVPKQKGGSKPEVLSAELLYAYMSMAEVDWEAAKWPIDRLLVLLEVIAFKQNPKTNKRTQAEILKDYKAINAKNRAALQRKT